MVSTSQKTSASSKSSVASRVEKVTIKAHDESPKLELPIKKDAQKPHNEVSSEHRLHMIATAAYYLAEQRGFVGGNEMHDWLVAERDIDSQLNL